MTLTITAKIQIQKPITKVFENIVNPEAMTQYFISKSTGVMESHKQLIWHFPEFDGDCPVQVVTVEAPNHIHFVWDTNKSVKINLTALGSTDTLVTITEGEAENTEAGLRWYGQNTEGWANFLACLKAYTEYNINLRKGAFDFLKKTT